MPFGENSVVIIGIVAIARNLAIGKDGKLPWHYPEDLKFFKRTTTGHTVVMGWNTWRSIGKPLPNRLNVVVSRHGELEETDRVKLLRNRDDVLELAKKLDGDVFVIGGSRTYETFAEDIEKWYVTEVPISVEDADTFMPPDFLNGFGETETIDLDDGLVVKVFVRH